MRWSRWLTPLCLFLVLLSLACSNRRERKEPYPVRGKVLVDGKAPEGARVVFHPSDAGDPQAILPQATVAADGTFVVNTYNFQDGAPEGTYTVTVTHFQSDGGVNLLPPRYATPDTSRLQVTVAKQNNELEPFHLTKQDASPKAP